MDASPTYPNLTVSQERPVFTLEQLIEISGRQTLAHGLTIYLGILVIWDEDHDERILDVIEQEWPPGRPRPLAVSESEGCLSLLWQVESMACNGYDGFYGHHEGDTWNADHYYLENNAVREFQPVMDGFEETEDEAD